MKAVIMAGGRGTRLLPLTSGRPKPMVPILNRPVLEHLIRLAARHGVTEVIVTTHYRSRQIREALGSGERFGVRISYAMEEEPLGTAGSVRQVSAALRETFLVLSGDALTDFSLSEAVAEHRRKGAMATLVVTRVTDPTPYGIVDAAPDGRITRFLEKPGPGEVFSNTVNSGIYVLEPEALALCPKGAPFDFSRDLFPRMLREDAGLFAFEGRGYWSDIGNCLQYIRSQADALREKVRLEGLPPASRPGVWIDARAWVDPSADLVPPVMIGPGAAVEARARVGPCTVLGQNTWVEGGALVEGSVIWEESRIGSDAVVTGAAVGRRAVVGRRARVLEGAAVGDFARVPAGSVVEAGGRVAAEAVSAGG